MPQLNRQTGTSLSDINIVPFVDVMLVLLIIFMITAPVLQSGIDVDLPKTQTVKEISLLLRDQLWEGKSVAIHCRQGVGRSALLSACVLALLGVDPGEGFQRIAAARKCPVPDTEEQRAWVIGFARQEKADASL